MHLDKADAFLEGEGVEASTQFDPYGRDFLENPYPTFARLRASRPVFYDDAWRLTFFTRFEDVKSIFMDRHRFGRDYRQRLTDAQVDTALVERIYPRAAPVWVKFVREAFMDREPPIHTRLRGLVSQAFTRRESHAYRPALFELAKSLLDQHLDGEPFDAMAGESRRDDMGGLSEANESLDLTIL